MLHDVECFPPDLLMRKERALSAEPFIHEGARVLRSRLGSWTEIGKDNEILESEIGDYSYTDRDTMIAYSTIGRLCSIAAMVRINPGNHPQGRVVQHHLTYRRVRFGLDARDDEEFFQWRKADACRIGHDVWIGHGAVVLAGVSIGTGAVIGAGAVVTKDVEPYAVAVGVPARMFKKRFSDQVIKRILDTEWWTWNEKEISERWRDFLDPRAFLEKYGKS